MLSCERLIPLNFLLLDDSKMDDYYVDRLAAENLKKCYEIAPSRTKQYLTAEIEHVINHLSEDTAVLELGCGYGRVLAQLVNQCSTLVGIDTSHASLRMAQDYLSKTPRISLSQMDAIHLGFSDDSFDVVVCIQNGISAFKVSPQDLLLEAYRVTKPNGLCMFSTYSPQFWDSRLEWFQLQAEAKLIGEIDWFHTKEGFIVCKDGFTSRAFDRSEFTEILKAIGLQGRIIEVDQSSLFCHIDVGHKT